MRRAADGHRLPARVVLVGVHGHGHAHLTALERLSPTGQVALVGVCDRVEPEPAVRQRIEQIAGGPVVSGPDLADVLDRARPDITIVCTPIHTHAPLTVLAARAGSHVLLEKPPTPTAAEFEEMLREVSRTGRVVQVGFQNLGSHAIPRIRSLVADGAIGELIGIGAACSWTRHESYFTRSDWAGKRRLHGVDVVDGVLTNPFAHAVATAIVLDGSDGADRLHDIELDLYRANDIEADDTSAVRFRTPLGTPVLVAAGVTADVSSDPVITVSGTRGSIEYAYKRDVVRVIRPWHDTLPVQELQLGTETLLENLAAHVRDPGIPLLVPAESTRAFMDLVEAVRTAPEPHPVPDRWVAVRGPENHRRRCIPGIESLVAHAASRGSLFRELGVPWAAPATPPLELPVLARLEVGGGEVARYVDGGVLPTVLGPRPFLHPVRTRGGTVVSADRPEDHPWHLGVGVALQDVGGNNLWGGRTYVRDTGYTWLEDHGGMLHAGFEEATPSGFTAMVTWTGHLGDILVREWRTLTADPIALPDTPEAAASAADATAEGWILSWSSTLHNATTRALPLGSPASNGRPGGGYGGFFWRLPEVEDLDVRTPDARGEEGVHGSAAPWLAVSGRTGGAGFTLVAAGADARTAEDPWFVRIGVYPAFGSSLAPARPLVLGPGEAATRRFRVLVADGVRSPAALAPLLRAAEPAGGAV